jgi:predicted nucleotidyltransferase
MFGLTQSDLNLIIKTIAAYDDVDKAIIFGSRAMGNYKPGSDVDIALKGNLDPDTASRIAIELNERLPLPYKFDVVAHSEIAHLPFREHIDQHGKTFFKRF